MIHGESYLLCNGLLCACALPLGGKLAGLPAPGKGRLGLSALVGGLAGLGARWLPPLMMLLSLPLAVWLCFGPQGLSACIRCLFTTLGATLLSGGAVMALLGSGASPLLSLLTAAGISGFLFLAVTLLPAAVCQVRQVELQLGDHGVLLPAMMDSGNLLRDPITGLPVLVIPQKAMGALLPQWKDGFGLGKLPRGFRLLNVRTAAGGGLLPLFRPDLCRLYIDGCAWDTQLLVAVAGKEYGGVQALVPTEALPRQKEWSKQKKEDT